MDLRDLTEFLKDTIGYIITAAIVFVVLIYVASFQMVSGPSMNDTLVEGDVLILNKIVYRFSKPQRNDIVVVNAKSMLMVKRIIGLPGETISYKNGILYIDGKTYKETNITQPTYDFSDVKLGDDEYFVMGDNRTNSEDSRDYGAVKMSSIVGKSSLRIYPFNKIGVVK
jgi:signal peptidase I